MTQAYRLFVLALGQVSEVGAMNRLKESKTLAPMSRYLLAAGYALIGRPDASKELIAKTTVLTTAYSEHDQTFGSELRDTSIRLLTLCLLDNGKEAALLANEISETLASDEWLSTQSTAFALVAFSGYMNKYKVSGSMDFSYTLGGKTEKSFHLPEHLDGDVARQGGFFLHFRVEEHRQIYFVCPTRDRRYPG